MSLWKRLTGQETAEELIERADAQARAEETTPDVILLKNRRTRVVERIHSLNPQMDPATLMWLLTMFGPLLLKMLETLVDRMSKITPVNITVTGPNGG